MRGFFEHCRDLGAACGAHTTIVSGEELSLLDTQQLRRLQDEILATDPAAEIEIILYYRNLYDLAISFKQQKAKKNRRVFDAEGDKRMISRLNPTQQIERFEEVFGEPHVKVGVFDLALQGEGLERHFLKLADVEWYDGFVDVGSANVSTDLITTTFLNLLGYEFELHTSTERKYTSVMSGPFVLPRLRNEMLDDLSGVVAAIDVSHPKLQNARAVLTAPNRVSLDRQSDVVDFLESFEALVHELRTALDQRRRRVERRDRLSATSTDADS